MSYRIVSYYILFYPILRLEQYVRSGFVTSQHLSIFLKTNIKISFPLLDSWFEHERNFHLFHHLWPLLFMLMTLDEARWLHNTVVTSVDPLLFMQMPWNRLTGSRRNRIRGISFVNCTLLIKTTIL